MSEKVTAVEVLLNRTIWIGGSQEREQIISVMEEYAAQQVQQIKEERDKAMEILKQANSILNTSGYKIEPWSPFAEQLQNFITSINQTNG